MEKKARKEAERSKKRSRSKSKKKKKSDRHDRHEEQPGPADDMYMPDVLEGDITMEMD